MIKRITWAGMALLAMIIGLYPLLYFFLESKFGLLSSKSDELLNNLFWKIGFYSHIVLGGLALLIGWIQFSPGFRDGNLKLHKNIGKAYVISALISSLAGLYIGFYATGGLITSLGFISLASIWFYTTLIAYVSIKNGQIEQHQKMMIYSYAACFSAVTLRIWLPILIMFIGNFGSAYAIVAWLCWIPNLLVAHLLIKRLVLIKE